jgi:membrane dipeptidase
MPGDFDFGLSQEQEQRARDLHASSISVDMCSMGPGGPAMFAELPEAAVRECLASQDNPILQFLAAMELPYELASRDAASSDLLRRYFTGHTAASYACGGTTDLELEPLGRLKDRVEKIEWMKIADCAEDFRRAQRERTYVTYGYSQPGGGGHPFDLGQFDKARDLGMRSVMLTYNNQDLVGAGCTDRTNAGLSNYGLQVLERLNELKLIVDTSHCGRQTTLDACLFSKVPVTANHTLASMVFNHDRGKSDEELRAIADTGGVIGVVAVPFFMKSPGVRADMNDMLDHIDYIASKVGWQHVGIGNDWPFMLTDEVAKATIGHALGDMGFREEHGVDISMYLDGYEDSRDFINITRGLVSRGYEDDAIRGILGGNFVRVFEDVVG